jgi:cytochrome c oxidase subunit 1
MADASSPSAEEGTADGAMGEFTEDSPSEAVGDLAGVFRDGVIGAVAGFAGVVLLSMVLVVAAALGAFDSEAFAELADLVGLGAFPQRTLIGYVIFMGGGMTTFPLLFASVQEYLPGPTMALRGVGFATIVWTGFLPAFYTGQSGIALALYIVLSLVAHWAYGFALGSAFDFFAERVGGFLGGKGTVAGR